LHDGFVYSINISSLWDFFSRIRIFIEKKFKNMYLFQRMYVVRKDKKKLWKSEIFIENNRKRVV